MKHHNHTQYPYSAEIKRRIFTRQIESRCEAGLSFLLAIVIGFGLAAVLVKWWFA